MTKATLHDELMREAGFETDYDQEVVRRRATRRRIARDAASFAVALGVFAGLLLEWGHGTRSAGVALAVLAAIGFVAGGVLKWVDLRKGGD